MATKRKATKRKAPAKRKAAPKKKATKRKASVKRKMKKKVRLMTKAQLYETVDSEPDTNEKERRFAELSKFPYVQFDIENLDDTVVATNKRKREMEKGWNELINKFFEEG